MKPIRFLGDSLAQLRGFPETARQQCGYHLWKVQRGESPGDSKSMPSVGRGVQEIRVREASGAYRVVYLARRPEAVYILHAFMKKSQATLRRDLALAARRYAELEGQRE